MKKNKFNIKGLALACALLLAGGAVAQFAVGPRIGNVVTIPTGGYILHSVTQAGTNLANNQPFALDGRNDLKLYIDWGATNATTGVSNYVFNFQISADGSKWIGPAAGDGGLPSSLQFTIAGPGAGDQLYTNLVTGASGGLSGYRWIRLHSITNNALGAASNTYYITNMYFSQF